MTKRKHDVKITIEHPLAKKCIRISDFINAKYFAEFLEDTDVLNLSKCKPLYYCDFYRFFANRIWWPLHCLQFVCQTTLSHIRKLSYAPYDWPKSREIRFPQHITSLLLVLNSKSIGMDAILLEKYKDKLQFLEVIGNCDGLHIPNGLKVFVQKYRDPGNISKKYDLELPNSLFEVSINCFNNQKIKAFPSNLERLTFKMLTVSAFGIQRSLLPSFPTTLLHLTLTDGFNQRLDEFPPNLISLTIQNKIWNQHLVSLPTSLQYFKLYGNSTIPVPLGVLPPSLKIFIYKSKCNILENVLPNELKYVSVTIGSEHGSLFDCRVLPSSVIQLNITSFHPYGLKNMEMIPKTLKIFKYKTCGQVVLSKLPQQLEELCLQTSQVIIEDLLVNFYKSLNNALILTDLILTVFPPNLKHLYVKANHFDPHLKSNVFPTTLETLYYNCNDRITRNILPQNLKSLVLGPNCKRLLVFGSLPKSLESFSAPHLSRKTIQFYQKTRVIPKLCLIK